MLDPQPFERRAPHTPCPQYLYQAMSIKEVKRGIYRAFSTNKGTPPQSNPFSFDFPQFRRLVLTSNNSNLGLSQKPYARGGTWGDWRNNSRGCHSRQFSLLLQRPRQHCTKYPSPHPPTAPLSPAPAISRHSLQHLCSARVDSNSLPLQTIRPTSTSASFRALPEQRSSGQPSRQCQLSRFSPPFKRLPFVSSPLHFPHFPVLGIHPFCATRTTTADSAERTPAHGSSCFSKLQNPAQPVRSVQALQGD